MRRINVLILGSVGTMLASPAASALAMPVSADVATRFDPAASHAVGGVVPFSSRVFDDVAATVLTGQRTAARPGAFLADAFDGDRPALEAPRSAIAPPATGGAPLDPVVTRPVGRSLGDSIDAPPGDSMLAIEQSRPIDANEATDFRMRTTGGDLRGAVVPLPAGGWLGLGGLSLLAVARRRRG